MSLEEIKKVSFEELEDKVVLWAEERNLLDKDPRIQLLKTVEELGELVSASLKGKVREEVDAVGDVLVTIIIYCHMKGLCPVRCLTRAFNEIEFRTGETKNGVFVRDI